MTLFVYIFLISTLSAIYAWYDAPFSSRWYQRLPRAMLAFLGMGGYVIYVLYDGIRTLRQKRLDFQALEQRCDEISTKHGF